LSSTDHTIEKVAELIELEFEAYNQKIIQELTKQAPETTPSNIEIRFGSPHYLTTETKSSNLLQGLIYSYIQQHNYNPKAPNSRKKFEKYIEDHPNWDADIGEHSGASVPGQDYIWMAFLPEQFENKMASDIENLVQNKLNNDKPQLFSKFIQDLSRRGKLGKKTRQDYKATAAHEITHLIIKQQTKLGQLFHAHETTTHADLEQSIANILGESNKLTKPDQAEKIGDNKYLDAIDEAFSFFISDKITNSLYPANPSRFSSYDDPKAISWSYNILLERYGQNISIDDLRKLQLKIFNEIAQRGQVQKGSGYRNPLIYMLKYNLPKKDKILLNEIRDLCEGDLSYAYRDLYNTFSDIESSANTQQASKFQSLEQRVDWDNPKELEDTILHRVLNDAIEQYTLAQTEKEIRKNIVQELKVLQEMVQTLKSLENQLNEEKLGKELSNAIKELKTGRK